MAFSTERGIAWIEMAMWPTEVGFTISERAFAKHMAAIKLPDGPEFTKGNGGTCHRVVSASGKTYYLICVNDLADISQHQKAAMIAHECAHVAQMMWRQIGEDRPGDEAEAYFVQYLVQNCLYALDEHREAAEKRRKRGKRHRKSRRSTKP